MAGARIFVTVAFVILGASFLASTGLLVREFQGADWPTLLLAHSHLFFFFPTLGLLALAAFYLPSVVFTHLYWTHLPYGRLRFLTGLLVVALVSLWVSQWLDAKPRSIWEVSPQALHADRGEPRDCGANRTACERAPILDTLSTLRQAGRERVGLSKFARNCAFDSMLEPPDEMARERYCFPAGTHLNGTDCCKVQRRFSETVDSLQADPAQRSLSGAYDTLIFLPLKTFFVLIVIAIGLLLSLWRRRVDQHYRELVPAIERGVIIGAFAMLAWPIMDYGYQQTSNTLFGRWIGGFQFRLSLVIAPWALLLLFYFLRRLGKQGEMIGQIAGVVTAAVALLRYEDLNDWAVRLLGVGTNLWVVVVILGLTVAGFFALLRPQGAGETPPPAA